MNPREANKEEGNERPTTDHSCFNLVRDRAVPLGPKRGTLNGEVNIDGEIEREGI